MIKKLLIDLVTGKEAGCYILGVMIVLAFIVMVVGWIIN